MVAWLQEPTVAWPNHFVRQAFRSEEEERDPEEYYRVEAEYSLKGIGSLAGAMTQAASAERNQEREEAKTHYLQRAIFASAGLSLRLLCGGQHDVFDALWISGIRFRNSALYYLPAPGGTNCRT